MNTSGEAAEQVVRMMLEGSEVLIKLTGSGAKNAAVLLYSILKQQKKTRGSAKLTNMLKNGRQLKVYTFKREDLKQFQKCAKEYGILYSVLKDKKDRDGVFDVLVRAGDDSKLTRVIERFKLSSVDTATVRTEIIKEQEAEAKAKAKEEEEKPVEKEQDYVLSPDPGDGPEEKEELERTGPDREQNIAELQALVGQEKPNENGNPTQASAESRSCTPVQEEGKSVIQSRDNDSQPLPAEQSPSEPEQSQNPEGSPSWPPSQKKKKQETRISLKREIEKKKAERAAKQKQEAAKTKPLEKAPKSKKEKGER